MSGIRAIAVAATAVLLAACAPPGPNGVALRLLALDTCRAATSRELTGPTRDGTAWPTDAATATRWFTDAVADGLRPVDGGPEALFAGLPADAPVAVCAVELTADDVPDDSDGLLVMGVQRAASAAVVGTGPFDVVDDAVHESVPEGPEDTVRFTP